MSPKEQCYAFVDGDHTRRYVNEVIRDFFVVKPPLQPAGTCRVMEETDDHEEALATLDLVHRSNRSDGLR